MSDLRKWQDTKELTIFFEAAHGSFPPALMDSILQNVLQNVFGFDQWKISNATFETEKFGMALILKDSYDACDIKASRANEALGSYFQPDKSRPRYCQFVFHGS